jgi:hypothetical protein
MKLSTKTVNWLLLSFGVIILIILLYLLFGDRLKIKIPSGFENQPLLLSQFLMTSNHKL